MINLDISLDEMIKTKKLNKKTKKLRTPRFYRGSNTIKDANMRSVNGNVNLPLRNYRTKRTTFFRKFNQTAAKLEALESQKKWKHDMYNKAFSNSSSRRLGSTSSATIMNNRSHANEIFVSNLGYEVTQEDLRELFGSVGPLKKCIIRFDKSGRSTGLAYVIFHTTLDARIAFNKYKNAKLDGKPMVLEIKVNQSHIKSSKKHISGNIRANKLENGVKWSTQGYRQNETYSDIMEME